MELGTEGNLPNVNDLLDKLVQMRQEVEEIIVKKEILSKKLTEKEGILKKLEMAKENAIKEEDKAKKEADRLLKAPIKKQIKILIDNLVFPDSKINHETLTEIKDKFESFKRWANDKVDQI